jgi:hypothetical protein
MSASSSSIFSSIDAPTGRYLRDISRHVLPIPPAPVLGYFLAVHGDLLGLNPHPKLGVYPVPLTLLAQLELTTIVFPLTEEARMVSIPKVVGIVSCGFLLCLGLSHGASAADDMKAGQSERKGGQVDQRETTVQMQGVHIIQGDVLRVEDTNYVVKRLDGREVSLHTDNTTVKTGNIDAGDRIEAKVNEQNHALSMLQAP